jgi:hypothetical protein
MFGRIGDGATGNDMDLDSGSDPDEVVVIQCVATNKSLPKIRAKVGGLVHAGQIVQVLIS